MMLICLVPFLVGVIGLWILPTSNPYGRLVCLWIAFAYVGTWCLSMTVAAANTSGHTKKITTNAFLLMGYCLGNFVGPFFFLTSQAPTYDLGVGMMFFCIGVQVICICSIWFLLYKRNAKRAAGWVGNERLAAKNGFMDLTDLENEQFMVRSSLLEVLSAVCLLTDTYSMSIKISTAEQYLAELFDVKWLVLSYRAIQLKSSNFTFDQEASIS